MGFEDRDYNRSAPPMGGAPQMPRTMVGWIILVNAAIFLIDAIWNDGGMHPLSRWMALPADIVSKPWGLLTYGFAHSPLGDRNGPGIFHILFNMYGLWLFGRDVERRYGGKEFLTIYLVLIIASGTVWALLNQTGTLIGASGAVSGVMVLFCLCYPDRKFFMIPIPFPVPAWVLCILLVTWDVIGALGHVDQQVAYAGHLAGAAFGFLYFKSGIRLTQFAPSVAMPSSLSGKPKLKVHQPSRRDARLEAQADAILRKVHEQGADSISAKERRILDEYSRSVREKNRQ